MERWKRSGEDVVRRAEEKSLRSEKDREQTGGRRAGRGVSGDDLSRGIPAGFIVFSANVTRQMTHAMARSTGELRP